MLKPGSAALGTKILRGDTSLIIGQLEIRLQISKLLHLFRSAKQRQICQG